MPKLKSTKKRLRQSIKRAIRNRARKGEYKQLKRQVKKAIAGKVSGEKVSALASKFYKAVDKAARARTIHKNKASREKSRLMALLKRGGAAVSAAKKSAKAKVRKRLKKTKSPRKVK